jgi:peptidoglycan/xylan/chitin deacetylase (PgdA/CDA1 family)
MSDVLVLCYHAVSERWPAELSVTPERLEEQLRLLVGRGYTGASFHEAVAAPPAPRTLAVTFDDAYRSVLELAFPILSPLGIPGTVFVATDFAGKDPMAWPGIDRWLGGPHEHELAGMSWSDLSLLAEAGWEIGSHTRSHPHLTRLDDASLEAELRGSRETCAERLGRPCRSLAYPYGDVDERVVRAAREAGYESAGTLPKRFIRPCPLQWPRVGVYHGDDARRFRIKVSRGVRFLRRTPLWAAAERMRYGVSRANAATASLKSDAA